MAEALTPEIARAPRGAGDAPLVTAPVAAGGGAVIILHSHLPYVLGHGVWPHGEHWLMESAAECYLPIVAVCRRLRAEGLRGFLTIGVTPVLAAQLADPRFPSAFDAYLNERRRQALTDARDFGGPAGDAARRDLALVWAGELDRARRFFGEDCGGDIVGAWRGLQDAGAIEVLTSALTHGYLPLLLNDVCVAGQVRGGVATYERVFGRPPRGIWLPECAYRPRYAWRPPGGGPPRVRAGIEEILDRAGVQWFVADTHLLLRPRKRALQLRGDRELERLFRTFRVAFGATGRRRGGRPTPPGPGRAYRVRTLGGGESRVAFLTRHPRTGTRVWNRDAGYPGNPEYLDFAKQHLGGLRYWRVTNRKGPIEAKDVYDPPAALRRARRDAVDFADDVARLRATGLPLVVAAYDTELFGHWWHEGPLWLEHVLRELAAAGPRGAPPLTGSAALAASPPELAVLLPEGSWGEGGFHWVWYNWLTRDLWPLIYACESDFVRLLGYIRAAARSADGGESRPLGRLGAMLAQELLLVESSDWPFLVTGGAAREYARARLLLHVDRFTWLRERLEGPAWSASDDARLVELERQDTVFPDLDLAWWPETPAAVPGPRAISRPLAAGRT